jgi:hypothetical protein
MKTEAGEGGKRIAEFPGASYSDACPKPKRKLQNDQNQNLTKIISRSFGCGSHQKTANFQMQRDRVEYAPNRARLDVTSLHGRLAVPLMRVR